MTTHERELTSAVDLCDERGWLADDARGWSRAPLHRANLTGRWGRTKRWDYWAILSDDHAVSVTYADVDYLGIVDVWWCELATGRIGGRSLVVPGARGVALPEESGSAPLVFDSEQLSIEIRDVPPGAAGDLSKAAATEIRARWREADGASASIEAVIDRPEGHESLNVVIPWSPSTFQFTSKHQARPARATLLVGAETIALGSSSPAWGVLDLGRGRWPYRTRWNWGGGAGVSRGGATIGLQLGGTWTVGTGFTENGVLVDGRLDKIGEELLWDYRWDAPMRPWRVTSPDGRLDLVLTPTFDRHSRTELGVLGTEVHQVFGRWAGRYVADDGREHAFDGLVGFAEESRSRW